MGGVHPVTIGCVCLCDGYDICGECKVLVCHGSDCEDLLQIAQNVKRNSASFAYKSKAADSAISRPVNSMTCLLTVNIVTHVIVANVKKRSVARKSDLQNVGGHPSKIRN